MRTSDFDYPLPEELIAQYPLARRSASRLLYVPYGGDFEDRSFAELSGLLRPGDLLVFNNTRVFPARVFGRKATGGRIELLVERLLGECQALVHLRASKSPKAGARLELPAGVHAYVEERQGELFKVTFDCEGTLLEYLEQVGHMPLPPYIDRQDEAEDSERYQTVYAQRIGAVAAPTAGLHFDNTLLDALEAAGIGRAFVTLHVGAGTFQPVRVERIQDHFMHTEQFEVPAEVCRRIEETRARNGRVVAVGTTVVRSLETAAANGTLQPFTGETNLFITPGYRFRCIDALITNFHLPRSSLLMLVCAFGGYERVMRAYQHAVWRRYRFFSYGDAMFIEKNEEQNHAV